ncbi:hypothetical protein NDU88_000313, partial [Pleurodeles waltl]
AVCGSSCHPGGQSAGSGACLAVRLVVGAAPARLAAGGVAVAGEGFGVGAAATLAGSEVHPLTATGAIGGGSPVNAGGGAGEEPLP